MELCGIFPLTVQSRGGNAIAHGQIWPAACFVNKVLLERFVLCSFHTVPGALEAGVLKWSAVPFSSGPRSVGTRHRDSSVLGALCSLAHSLSELDKAVAHVISLVSFL